MSRDWAQVASMIDDARCGESERVTKIEKAVGWVVRWAGVRLCGR